MWAIAFNDGNERNYWREELYSETGEFIDYGEVMLFDSMELAKKGLLMTDNQAFDFYIMELTNEEQKEVTKWKKMK